MSMQGVGSQEKPKSCQRSFWTAPNHLASNNEVYVQNRKFPMQKDTISSECEVEWVFVCQHRH